PLSTAIRSLRWPPPSQFSRFFLAASPLTAMCTLSLHDALPIFDHRRLVPHRGPRRDRRRRLPAHHRPEEGADRHRRWQERAAVGDRKSTRLNSSHVSSSYAVFCLKKKKTAITHSCST